MDRHIVYPAQIPLDTDILNIAKDGYVALGWLAESAIGTSVAVSGLAVGPTSPASLQVIVSPGAIYSLQTADSSSFGSIGTDATQFVKQGLLKAATNLTLTPPGTTGQSTNFLVQVQFSEVDSVPVTLPYYNAANPSVAWSGPANSGTAQNTVRKDTLVVSLKAGTPAATGSQTTPAPDAGYTGIYVITVANGQTAITSGNISALATAPFFPTLPSIPSAVQKEQWVSAIDTGTAAALVAALTPAPAAYAAFMRLTVQVANTATGAATINVNALGAKSIVDHAGAAIIAGFWQAGNILDLVYDGTSFRVVGGNTPIGTAFSTTYSTSQSLSNSVLSQSALNNGSAPFGSVVSNGFTFSRAGTYAVAMTANMTITVSSAAGSGTSCQIRQNGGGVPGAASGDSDYLPAAQTASFTQYAVGIINAAVGDIITIFASAGSNTGFSSASLTSASLTIIPLS